MKFTENKNYFLKEIDPKTARELVKKYHYSGKVVSNSKLHLGVFDKNTNELCGVLQYGYPMNPKTTPCKLVKNSNKDEMFELNRMAMTDASPKMSESQAIGLSIKWIKRYMPHIKWLLSFSDGKELNVGTIYQATNWGYYGYNVSDSFYDLDGEVWHNVQIWHKFKEGKPEVNTSEELYKTFDNVSKISSKQHIYIYTICNSIEILRDKESYPKKENEKKLIKRIIYKQNGVVLPNKKVITY